MKELSMLVDNRERNLDIIESLEELHINLSFQQLPVGDYIVSDRMGIERKTISDFESSIIDSRLFEQATRLKAAYEKPVLILEGDMADSTLGRNVIIGTILALYIDYGIQIIHSSSAIETSYILSKFAEREQIKERREPSLRGSKRAFTDYQWQTLMLTSLPGVGPSLARNLLSQFKSLRNIANADIKELTKVAKIGKKKAERIHEVLNMEFKGEKV